MPREVYVLHVKPRTEKKVLTYLAAYRCVRYLPLYTKVTKVQRRRVKRELPLFPGYVFACLKLVHQLRQVSKTTKATANVKVVNPFKAGDFVRLKSGPLFGLTGYVRREGARATIVVNVDILGQAVETSVSPADCELVADAQSR